jgi:hypothetical protein
MLSSFPLWSTSMVCSWGNMDTSRASCFNNSLLVLMRNGRMKWKKWIG